MQDAKLVRLIQRGEMLVIKKAAKPTVRTDVMIALRIFADSHMHQFTTKPTRQTERCFLFFLFYLSH